MGSLGSLPHAEETMYTTIVLGDYYYTIVIYIRMGTLDPKPAESYSCVMTPATGFGSHRAQGLGCRI